MPPSDYRHHAEVIGIAPYAWLKLRAAVKSWKLRNDKDTVEGHRVLRDKR